MVERAKEERKKGRNVNMDNRKMWVEGREWVWDEKKEGWRIRKREGKEG